MLEYAELGIQTMGYRCSSLLAYWTQESETLAALELAQVLIQFKPDPKASEKHRKEPSEFFSHLDPSPRFEEWDYREILNSGVRPLAEKEPYRTACMLIDAMAAMLGLRMHPEQREKSGDRDDSEFWCRRLDRTDTGYMDSKVNLANALTFACEQVYEKTPTSIPDLDDHLRKQRWRIFKRLRQHLLALYPTELTKPWIRDLILNHEDYGRSERYYELQEMVRSACAAFGEELLTRQERILIFKTILAGPPKEKFRKWYGEDFTEGKFELRQLHFHRMQLRLFEDVLFGDYLARFQETERQADKQISSDDYLSISDIKVGSVSAKSPKPPEQLAAMEDAELLDFINEWDAEHYDYVDQFVEITFEALVKAFQEFFTDAVLPDDGRIRFWIENRGAIARPIYVRAIVDGMKDLIESKNFERLGESLEFCEWVLCHPDQDRENYIGNEDRSRNNPLWASSRRAVVDLIDTCIKKEVNVPYAYREQLVKLLDTLCTQFDWRLDRNKPVLTNANDHLAEAINNTRSRALDSLIRLGSWMRRLDGNADLGIVTAVLEDRFTDKTEFSLTLPERAILGANYVRLLGLDETWGLEHKSDFFPQNRPDDWQVAFGSYLREFGPNIRAFEELGKDYEFGVRQLAKIKRRDDSDTEFSDYLGRHLFFYYLWGQYPLQGEESLLERFYLGTKHDRKCWSNLVENLGSKLGNTKEGLDEDLKRGLVEFFEWRLEAGDTEELGHFSSWLEAKCLEAEWRLDALSKVLDATGGSTSRANLIVAEALEGLLPEHTNKVVECFAKLTAVTNDSSFHSSFYINVETARNIIGAGLESKDEATKENAEHARENLLRRGFFDLLNLED